MLTFRSGNKQQSSPQTIWTNGEFVELMLGPKTPSNYPKTMRINQFHLPVRHVFEENVYFSRLQLAEMLGISPSCLSKQLKHVMKSPGCQKEQFYIGSHEEKCHYKITYYNLNAAVGVAFRVNNAKCRAFLEDYHRSLLSMRFQMSGSNSYIPSVMTPEEFHYYANSLALNVGPDPEYEDWVRELQDLTKKLKAKRHQSADRDPE